MMSNRLKSETSPYLLQHAENPVDWYPWADEAFEKAEREDKPIFLSIGYSTCHWCHVMARESFENEQIAEVLNHHYVCIKVDREERPDVDQVYMTACQAMTGSGGWPTSLFLTPDRKPFFAGTYFPPQSARGMQGFYELISHVAEQWRTNKALLLRSADEVLAQLKTPYKSDNPINRNLPQVAVSKYKKMFDSKNGGFGWAPKFPTPHNLLFLMLYGKLKGDSTATEMALHTLAQMLKGGIHDHIGGGFSRYSTDKYFLVPHFEKMLYDNALLLTAYSVAYSVSGRDCFLEASEQCAEYVIREMTDGAGGFYSAQDADSAGGEGQYYLFGYDEVISVLGEERGGAFNEYYGITKDGNFEGKNIPNRLHGEIEAGRFVEEKRELYEYRKSRMKLHLDDKILTSWNALMIVGMTQLYRVSGKTKYLDVARRAIEFIENNLLENDRLFVGSRNGKRFGKGYLDDYAFYCTALLAFYSATGEHAHLASAKILCRVAVEQFGDTDGGFLLNGKENEKLIFSAKETYDGAMPSGNSMLGFVLARLAQLEPTEEWEELKNKQEEFLFGESAQYPTGHSVFLLSLLFSENPPPKITVVCGADEENSSVVKRLPLYADLKLLPEETPDYKMLNGKTTFYVCHNHTCYPPTNEL